MSESKVNTTDFANKFRNIVSNSFIPDIDYYLTNFTFKTLALLTGYSYCYCPCSYEHEFANYINENGEIDEEKFRRVLQCVVDGQCPHVDQVSAEFVQDSTTNGMTIAAVVGMVDALQQPITDDKIICEGMFLMSPVKLALIKNPKVTLEDYPCFDGPQQYDFTDKILATRRLENQEDDKVRIHFEEMSTVEYVVRYCDIEILKKHLKRFSIYYLDMVEAVEAAFRHGLSEQQEILLTELLQLDSSSISSYEVMEFTKLAVIYNKPAVLERYLNENYKHEKAGKYTSMPQGDATLLKMGVVLHRENCQHVLKYWCKPLQMTEAEKVKELMKLLVHYDFLEDEILHILEATPNVSELLNHVDDLYGTCLQIYNNEIVDARICKPDLLKKLLELGADNHSKDSESMAALEHILSVRRDNLYPHGATEEAYIYENPSLNKSTFKNALNLDTDSYTDTKEGLCHVGEVAGRKYVCVMDNKEHGLHGHDDVDFALNFTVPFLIECGFDVSENDLFEYEDEEESLHPAEQEYIRHYLENPRSLMKLCCISLRKHYEGRQIHKFVKTANLPEQIKDYILLKPLLKSVPKHLLD